MTWLQGLILGVVQGVTEFLPVSSSGHLMLADKLLGIRGNSLALDVFLHAGTLTAVLLFYWRDIAAILRNPFGKLARRIAASTIPTLIIALLFAKTFEQIFHSGATLGIEFVITGTLLLFIESRTETRRLPVEKMGYVGAIWIGLAQGAAILPALSRSALTISAALGVGVARQDAVRYSFLLSVPVILGATLYEAHDMGASGLQFGPGLWMAFGAAAITGYAAIVTMMRIVKKSSLRGFGYYATVIGVLVIVDQLWIHRFF